MDQDKTRPRWWCPVAQAAATVACAFAVLLGILMIAGLFAVREASPLERPEMDRLRARLQAEPADADAQAAFRQADLALRQAYFGGLSFLRVGGTLLVAGVGLALLSLMAVAACRWKPPDPRQGGAPEKELEAARRLRFTLAATGLALGVAAAALGVKARLEDRPGPVRSAEAAPARAPEAGLASAAAGAGPGGWPAFRGPSGSGVCDTCRLPAAWDSRAGSGLRWKAPVPLPGRSSPVAWGNRIFLTGATADQREVYCFDLATGRLLWRVPVDAGASVPVEVMEDTGHAAPTPAADGTNVYAVFANGDVAAIDFCSTERWSRNLGLPENRYGFASSPLLFQGQLIIQFDNQSGMGGVSELLALDKATGSNVWKAARQVEDSWASPIVADPGGGPQIIAAANEAIMAYDPATGAEVWKAECRGSDTASSPLFAGGLVIVPVANDQIYALRPGRAGETEAGSTAWTVAENVSDVPSPVARGEWVFFLNAGGTLACAEIATGRKVWDHELGEACYASPVIAGDRLLVVARNGEVWVVRAGPRYEELGRFSLGEPSDATPALLPGAVLLRGATNLFCFGEGAGT